MATSNRRRARVYASSLPVTITVGTDGTVSVAVDVVDISEAVYDHHGATPRPTERQHAADIRRAVDAKHAGTITVEVAR